MSQVVRAKYKVTGRNKADMSSTVYLTAVIEGEENKAWAHATPAGSIIMVIGNPVAAALFEPGRELHVDFSEA